MRRGSLTLCRLRLSMLHELRDSSLLLAAITTLRDDARAGDEAVQGQREAAPETGTGGAYGALLRFARGHGLVSSEEWLSLLSPLEGGNEHEVFQDARDPVTWHSVKGVYRVF